MAFPIARHLSVPFFRWRVASAEGLGNIPRTGPALLVANHVGQQDPLLLTYAILRATGGRAPHTIAKWKIFHSQFTQDWLGTIPLYPDRKQTVARSEALLRSDELVLVYPEARINPLPTIGKVKTGAARLAVATRVPVIPIGLTRTNTPPQSELGHTLDMFLGRVRIRVGQPLDLSRWYDRPVDKVLLDEVSAAIMTPVAALAGKTYSP